MADDTNTAERITDEMVHAALRAKNPTLYLYHLRHPLNGPVLSASTEKEIQVTRKMLDAALGASLAASAGSEPVAPSEDVQKKIQSNTWDHFGAILPTLKAISRGDWYWGANSRCKYIEIRLDTRDGGCLLFDRERVRISPEQFAHQSHGGVKMEPWPVANLTHPSPPEGMAGWKPIASFSEDEADELLAWKPELGRIMVTWLPDGHPDADEGEGWHEAWSHKRVRGITHACIPPAPPLPASAKEL